MTEPVSNPRARVCECGAVLRVKEVRGGPMGVIVIYHRCKCGGVREWVRRFWGGSPAFVEALAEYVKRRG